MNAIILPARRAYLAFFSLLIILFSFGCSSNNGKTTDWSVYNGSAENLHYSDLTQVDTNNVKDLQVAWEYHTGDGDTVNHSQIQCNPLIIEGVMYGTTPQMKLFAIEAATGREKWVFNAINSLDVNKRSFFVMNNCRGIAFNKNEAGEKRIYYTAGSNLFCIDAENGKPVAAFGDSGKVDLHNGLGRDVKDLFVTATSPGIIYKDILIMGTRVDEGPAAAPGHIRGYDVSTGKLRWIFHTIPHPGEKGYETWDDTAAYKHIGGANAWSGFALDEKRGIVFAATGSASFDFYGGKRTGSDLFADCVLALDAASGKYKWHFQDIHHDVWDRDIPVAPSLVTITKDGKKIDALAQSTKSGFIFLLDRMTGEPLYSVNELAVPTTTALRGEKIWPTQPIPSFPKPFARQLFTAADINPLLPDSSIEELKTRLATYKTGNMFNPPSKEGTIVFPGFDGGGEWGGPAYDSTSQVMYVNANEMPWVLTMVEVNNSSPLKETYAEAGARLFKINCMVCHGANLQGTGNNPSLVEAYKKYMDTSFNTLIASGRRMMPSFKHLADEEKNALATFVLNIVKNKDKKFTAPVRPVDPYLSLPYKNTGYNKFLSKEGYPGIRPPWGTLNAVSLNTGDIIWKDTLGTYPEFAAKGIKTGSENYGGPVVTAGGVLFIAATRDGKFRAFNKRTGQLLWETNLPAPGFATPAIYQLNGKQYIVIACGGGKLGTISGDSYVSFALPGK